MSTCASVLIGGWVLLSGTGPAEGQDEWSEERLVELLRDLSAEAFDKFVVKDPNRRTYAMCYEFERDGRLIQAFGLDSMHDGAWFLSALATAHRVDPEGGHLEMAQNWQVPFYVNVVSNSDRIFPNMIPRPGQEEFDAPIKGWAPRGWDDGLGFNTRGKSFATMDFYHDFENPEHQKHTAIEKDGDRITHSYFTSSHHLSQDIADALLNVWLTTRDPTVARAIQLIDQSRINHGRRVPVIMRAAGLSNEKSELYRRASPPAFEPAKHLRPLWKALVERKAERVGHYNDDLAWSWNEEVARAAISGDPIPPGYIAASIGRVYSQLLGVEAYYGDAYRPGMTLQNKGLSFEEGTGQLARRPDEKSTSYSRPIQYAWIAAALLPEFRDDPSAWHSAMQQLEVNGSLAKLQQGSEKLGVEFSPDADVVAAQLSAEVAGTIEYWAAVREKHDHLPRYFFVFDESRGLNPTAELGAYAHLMKCIAFHLMDRRGKREVDLIREQTPSKPLRHEQLPDSVLKAQGLMN